MNEVNALLTILISWVVSIVMGYRNFRNAKKYADENFRISQFREAVSKRKIRNLLEEKQKYADWLRKCKQKVIVYWIVSIIYVTFINYGLKINNRIISNIWVLIVSGVIIMLIMYISVHFIDYYLQYYSDKYQQELRLTSILKRVQVYIKMHKHMITMLLSPVISFILVASIIVVVLIITLKITVSMLTMMIIANIVAIIPIKIAMDEFVKNYFIMVINPFEEIL